MGRVINTVGLRPRDWRTSVFRAYPRRRRADEIFCQWAGSYSIVRGPFGGRRYCGAPLDLSHKGF
jgi:hypothetical protein